MPCPICELPLGDDPEALTKCGGYRVHTICFDIVKAGQPVTQNLHTAFSG